MKTESEIDAIMAEIPEKYRTRWCGGERGPCWCLGCVQICNRSVMFRHIVGREFPGDPEHLSEVKLQEHRDVYDKYKITGEEWSTWMQRHGHLT